MKPTLSDRECTAFVAIEKAPKDGTPQLVFVGACKGLPAFVTIAAYHEDGGWTADEFREAQYYMPGASAALKAFAEAMFDRGAEYAMQQLLQALPD